MPPVFPVYLNALPSDTRTVEVVMEQLLDRSNGMWTKFGLRSLSSKDSYFQSGDNYWTSLIWLNINYLAVVSVFEDANHPGEYPVTKRLRSKIRLAYLEIQTGLTVMVVKSYVATGFIWEVYDGDFGNGFNNHPFTGWSALIVNITAELY